MLKSLKNEKDKLQKQVTQLESILAAQKTLIDKINFDEIEIKKEDKKSFKKLIGL